MSEPESGVMEGLDADQLAAVVGSVPEEQIAAGMADPENRKNVLDEIFRRMAEHVEPEKAKGQDAVVHFKITDKPGGGEDHYEVVLKDGVVTVSDQPSAEPRLTLTTDPVTFIQLVTGNAQGPALFMAGKLRIEGDLMFAATMTGLFRIPKPATPTEPTTAAEPPAA